MVPSLSSSLLEKRHLLETCDLNSEEWVTNLIDSWPQDHGLRKKNAGKHKKARFETILVDIVEDLNCLTMNIIVPT